MWMSVPEDWTTVSAIPIVLTLLGVFYADVMRVIMDILAVVSMLIVVKIEMFPR